MPTKHLCVLIQVRILMRLVLFKPSLFSYLVLLLRILFVICLCHTAISVSYSLDDTCWDWAEALALLYVMFSRVLALFHMLSWVRCGLYICYLGSMIIG